MIADPSSGTYTFYPYWWPSYSTPSEPRWRPPPPPPSDWQSLGRRRAEACGRGQRVACRQMARKKKRF